MSRPGASHAGLSVPAFVAWPLLAAGLIVVVWGTYRLGRESVPTRPVPSAPRIEEVRKLAKLAVLRVQVANVIEGRTRGAQAAVLVKGDCDIAVDLDQIEIIERDDDRRTATLVLPTPRPDRPRVDHDRTRIYELRKTGLATINPFADPRQLLLEDCMRAAQDDVERAVSSAEFVAQAKSQAELLLTTFYRQMGWTIAVQWK